MRRYRVEVTRPAVYFVDAETPEQASAMALAWASARQRPDYSLEATANVDVVAGVIA